MCVLPFKYIMFEIFDIYFPIRFNGIILMTNDLVSIISNLNFLY